MFEYVKIIAYLKLIDSLFFSISGKIHEFLTNSYRYCMSQQIVGPCFSQIIKQEPIIQHPLPVITVSLSFFLSMESLSSPTAILFKLFSAQHCNPTMLQSYSVCRNRHRMVALLEGDNELCSKTPFRLNGLPRTERSFCRNASHGFLEQSKLSMPLLMTSSCFHTHTHTRQPPHSS